MSRVEVPVGIVGVSLKHEPRQVPDDSPPPWQTNQTLTQVGQPVPRSGGSEKVFGRARYTTDIQRPGMLYGRILRSAVPHARIHRIDLSEALKQPGVVAAVTLPHLLGVAGPENKTAHTRVLYCGQPLAAVAAKTRAQAEAALAKIKVDQDVLPFVVDPFLARKPDAPLVFEKPVVARGSAGGGGSKDVLVQTGNLRGPKQSTVKGREAAQQAAQVKQALLVGPVSVRETFRTQVQTHSALETHSLVAEWNAAGSELTVWASTQGIFSVRDELAEALGVPPTQIRVISDYTGGGFGAKFGAGNYGLLAALLARAAKAPVQMVLSRKEEHLAVGNRPGSEQTVALAASQQGKLTAIEVKGYGFPGAGAGAGFSGPALKLYECPAIYVEETDVFTHTGPLAAFRAPGHPQGAFALEQAMDALAVRLGICPVELRDRNDLHPARRQERKAAKEAFSWHLRHPPGQGPRLGRLGHIRRGMGMAQGLWYRFVSLDSHAQVRIHRDGSVEVLTGVQDIGNGVSTVLAQVVAEELHCPLQKIKVLIGDTRLPPGPASGGSVTTGSITPAVRKAAWVAKQSLLAELKTALGLLKLPLLQNGQIIGEKQGQPIPPLSFVQACGKMRKNEVLGHADRHPDFAHKTTGGPVQLGGVQMAEVEVNTLTGVVTVLRLFAAQDCGRPLNPLLCESQIHGGLIQGLSYALFEERRLDPLTGRMLNSNLDQYKIAGAVDVPDIQVLLLEELAGLSYTDAAGIGEPPTVPTAAAIANAVYNAIGVRIRELPITPARVLGALGKTS